MNRVVHTFKDKPGNASSNPTGWIMVFTALVESTRGLDYVTHAKLVEDNK